MGLKIDRLLVDAVILGAYKDDELAYLRRPTATRQTVDLVPKWHRLAVGLVPVGGQRSGAAEPVNENETVGS